MIHLILHPFPAIWMPWGAHKQGRIFVVCSQPLVIGDVPFLSVEVQFSRRA